jgi:hypothetical protein
MRNEISAAVRPRDFVEAMLVNDVLNLFWETLRLRRLRAALLQTAAFEPDGVAKVDAALAAAGLTRDEVMAETLALKIDEVERISMIYWTTQLKVIRCIQLI